MARRLFSFPNPVNEVAARLVAGGVLVLSIVELATRSRWLLIPLAYGFWARVLTGPKLSPLGQFMTRIAVPRLPFAARLVPGPPKRFAQAIGATVTTAALVAWLLGVLGFSDVLVGLLIVAATLESVFGLCLGCKAFAALKRIGVIPESVCLECAARLDVRAQERIAARMRAGASGAPIAAASPSNDP
jgi:Domain of unknown function (DUF4395)